MKKVVSLLILFSTLVVYAAATRTITADAIKSSDQTKTWSMPAATDTLVGRASTDTLSGKSISADSNTITNIDNNEIKAAAAIAVNKLAALTASRAVVSDGSGFLASATTTATEIGYVNGVTSAIQTQLDGKEASITTLSIAKGGTNSGAALNNNRVMISSGSAIVEATAITASRALVSDANGIPVHATTTATEIGYVNGVTSAIQTQLNAKAADADVVKLTGAQTVAGVKTFSDYVERGVTDSITAFATGGQASATQLTKDFNRVTTVASPGDSVKLPSAIAGREVTVINDGASILAVFPASGESIDALAANASTTLNPDASAKYVCLTDGVWQSQALGGGGGETFQGSNTSPKLIVAASGITSSQISTTATRQVIYAEGSVAATECDISSNPQIAAHTVVGAYLEIIGTSSTAPIKLENGTGLSLKAASRILNQGSVLGLRWNESASVYQEVLWSE